ncbi:DoxX family protein [Consotaella salsifontis]|uniref:Putative oxidoreductase n=1 Tax=Consotaella salsifontis TaxID=1365950 RepID=A0A1T4Q0X1_9HYPH|nr:DoxX family protein [Consotaella salsifontis]SJZ96848.1 putative oxidoreductase [Consotaella salsifontis]
MSANILPLSRLLLSVLFIVSGFGKLMGAAGFSGYLTNLGFPAPLAMAYIVGAFEFFGGLAILVGFQTRVVAILLALFCVATGLLAHLGDSTALMKNIGLAGGFLALAAAGPGAFAFDTRSHTGARKFA